jgi:tetratricopeptide (TPR) repeat protein
VRSIILLLLSSVCGLAESRRHDTLDRAVEFFTKGQYQEAAHSFEKAIALGQSETEVRLYLATCWMRLYVPGADSEGNNAFARKAEAEFKHVLRLKPNNEIALDSLAFLAYQRADGVEDPVTREARLDEARSWYQKLSTVNPKDEGAYYFLGLIAWAKWYPSYNAARAQDGTKPEAPGPIRDLAVRQNLKSRYGAMLEDGIANTKKALNIDPQYDVAMANLSLLLREKADLRDTQEEYREDIEAADNWAEKALEIREERRGTPAKAARTKVHERARLRPTVQNVKLIRKVDPVYSAHTRIPDTIRFRGIIGTDGLVLDLQLLSGRLSLVSSAQGAVRQWVYAPTLLNGKPVEVVTMINVKFVPRP